MALEMKFTEERPHVFSVRLNGAIDSETYMDLENELKTAIDDNTKAVILDMEDVNYVSSAGIRSVMWARRTLKEKNANFSMVNMKPDVKKIFDVMKLLPVLDIFDDMPQADEFIDQIINEELERGKK